MKQKEIEEQEKKDGRNQRKQLEVRQGFVQKGWEKEKGKGKKRKEPKRKKRKKIAAFFVTYCK